jgi:Putative L-xylulose-5-phosphate 3-epimerase
VSILPAPFIYEKAMPEGTPIPETLRLAREHGFQGIEISVDSSREKLARLDWGREALDEITMATKSHKSLIGSITLSCHRDFPLGTPDAEARRASLDMGYRAITIASDLAIPMIQIAGYFAHPQNRDAHARSRFIECLDALAMRAQELGVQLALENVDGTDVVSAADAISIVKAIDRPSLRLYVDPGNFVANGLEVVNEMSQAMPFVSAIQLKDTRIGEFRRVPFGEGIVPFGEIFKEFWDELAALPVSIEVWNASNGEAELRSASDWWALETAKANSDRLDQHQCDHHGHNH